MATDTISAFSPKDPLVVLDDLSTESGRNAQQGYMQLYAVEHECPKSERGWRVQFSRQDHFSRLS
jgi:hypothetical protein